MKKKYQETNDDIESGLAERLLQEDPNQQFKKTLYMSKAPRSFKNFRICDKCDDLKPPRSHHCSICQKCVMRMDHHCPWTGNCIGLKNHKYFICFCFWTIIACLHVAVSSFWMNSNCTLWPKIENIRYSQSFYPLNP